jgi:hypothetical protein
MANDPRFSVRLGACDGGATMRNIVLGAFTTVLSVGCALAPADGAEGPDGKGDLFDRDGDLIYPVELKVTLTDASARRVVTALGLGRSQSSDIYFYDTPDLELFDSGVILRARKISGAPDDSTIKIRPLDPEEALEWIPEVVDESGFKCEIDRSPNAETSSCSLTTGQDSGEIDDVADGDRRIDQLYSSEQELVFETFSPVYFDDLIPLGPIDADRWRLEPDELRERLTVERWTLPDGSLIVELSMRVEQDEADEALEELLAFAEDEGLEVGPDSTKTRLALEQLAER